MIRYKPKTIISLGDNKNINDNIWTEFILTEWGPYHKRLFHYHFMKTKTGRVQSISSGTIGKIEKQCSLCLEMPSKVQHFQLDLMNNIRYEAASTYFSNLHAIVNNRHSIGMSCPTGDFRYHTSYGISYTYDVVFDEFISTAKRPNRRIIKKKGLLDKDLRFFIEMVKYYKADERVFGKGI